MMFFIVVLGLNSVGNLPKQVLEFLLRGMSYPRLRLGGQCVNFIVCVYFVLLDLRSSPTVLSTLLLLTQSILCQAHQKHTAYTHLRFYT
jgi:hypothetical protein